MGGAGSYRRPGPGLSTLDYSAALPTDFFSCGSIAPVLGKVETPE